MAFDWLSFVVSLAVVVGPGVPLVFGLLKGVSLSRFVKFGLGVCAGFALVPMLLLAEFSFLGIPLNAVTVLANALLVTAIGVVLLYAQGQWTRARFRSVHERYRGRFREQPPSLKGLADFLWKHKALVLVLALMLVGFWIRFSPAWVQTPPPGPNASSLFFEFDPYYYMKLTAKLVNQGSIPLFTQESYYPDQAFHHYTPLTQYLTGAWYVLGRFWTGVPFDKIQLISTAQIYPPLVGALLAFLAFLLMREEYGDGVGVLAAGFITFNAQLVSKFASGVAEQQPWGLFVTFLVLTTFMLALRARSRRGGILAGVALASAIVGSQQYIWSVTILIAFIGIMAVLDFLTGKPDERVVQAEVLAALGLVAGTVLLYQYQQGARTFSFLATELLVGACAFSALLTFLPALAARVPALRDKASAWFGSFTSRAAVLAVLVVLALAALFTLGIAQSAVSYFSGVSSIAKINNPVGFTIQEESSTPDSVVNSLFNLVNPRVLVLLAALVATLSMAVALLAAKKRLLALAGLGIAAALLVFNGVVDSILTAVTSPLANPSVDAFVKFFVASDVFLYMAVALVAVMVTYLVTPAEKRSRVPLLIALLVFPIAYIGLSKVKYILHFSTALAFAVTFMFGELVRALGALSAWSGLMDERKAHAVALGCVLLVGAFLVFAQATAPGDQGAFAVSNGLKQVRISSDWADTYDWMRANTPSDARILSWWDYGHWTTFLGERATVIDPNNAHGDYNQDVARAFVNGRDSDIYDVMDYHHATHVLVDAELIQKWGALVFLSGTCSGDFNFATYGTRASNVCPPKAEIDFTKGPGQSEYEATHQYEFISDAGQDCPAALAPATLHAFQSSTGAVYCASPSQYFIYTRNGLLDGFARNYQVFGRDNISAIRSDTSYWYPSPFGGGWVNLNPDLSFAKLNNTVLMAAYTRLYFLESFPGFKLAYRSKNGEVKVFEYTGRPTPAPTPSPNGAATVQPNPAASPAPIATTPTVETNPARVANQTNQTNTANSTTNATTTP